MPAASVILPCHNAAATIDETLESLARQTLADFEVIAVNDGSTDATGERLTAWAARDSRFRVFSQPHGGVVAAANAALERASAPFIARMDSDDRAHPQRLEKQVACLRAHPDVAVVGSWVRAFHEDGVREGYRIYIEWLNSLVTDADIRREIFVESPLANPSTMLRREWFERMGGYHDYGWPEDYDLWLRMYLAGAKFA
jgi:glycosyltransferase involved in cell wall biosynthesis